MTGSVDPDGDQSNNNDNFFTVKRDAATGALRWTHSYGANAWGNLDLPADLIVDPAGNLWLGGSTSSPPYAGTSIVLGIDAVTGQEFERRTIAPAANRSIGVAFLRLDAAQNLLVGSQSRDNSTFDTDIVVAKYATRATVRATGVGCPGSGTSALSLASTGLPTIPGPTFAFAIAGGPPALVHAVGLALGASPFAIPFGAAGCTIQIDLFTLVSLVAAPGGVMPLPIPAAPSLRGLHFSAQGVVLDGNTGEFVTSNALLVMLGQ